MLALLGNVVVGMFCAPPLKANGTGSPADLLGALVICTEHGEQTLADDASAPAAPIESSKPCQICTAVASLLVPLVVAVLLALLPLAPATRFIPDFRCAFARPPCRVGLGSRAPPLTA